MARQLKLSFLTIVVVVFGSVVVCQAQPSTHAIATVKTLKGQVQILREDAPSVTAETGMMLFGQDTVVTGPDSSIGVIFKDNSLLSLGPDSHFQIEAFAFEPAEQKFTFVAKILKGTLSYLSGLMTRLKPESVEFRTPSAAICVRGTRLAIAVKGK